jgi:tetratricopeptide (TPR) repeat protein
MDSSQPCKEEPKCPTPPSQPLSRLTGTLLLAAMALLVFAVYSNSLQVPLLFDDIHNIKDNSHIRLTELSLKGITEAAFASPSPTRPVANISFAFNYYFHGYEVFGYHLINILIHLITGLLLYLFIKETLNLPSIPQRYKQNNWIPFITALIWLLHPLQTQSVTYIVQRMNSMAVMFYMLSFWLYIKARLARTPKNIGPLYAGSVLAGILALTTKEISATLPIFIFIYEWFFFQDLNHQWLKRNLGRISGVLLVLALIMFFYMGAHPFDTILAGFKVRDFTIGERVLTEFRVVLFYLSLLALPLPSRLNLQHDFSLSHSLIDPISTLVAIAIVLLLLGSTIYLARRDRLMSFCILWFFGNLVIESSVVALEIIYEHRNYLPSMMIILMAVAWVLQYNRSQRPIYAALCGVALLCAIWTYQRNNIWQDDLGFWQDCVEKSPALARPRSNLGLAMTERGLHAEAIEQLTLAIQIKPDFFKAHYNLGNAYKDTEEVDKAIKHYSEALRLRPNYAESHNNLGNLRAKQGKTSEAIEHYLQALRIKPDYADAHNNLGVALAAQGNFKEALQHYRQALRIDSQHTGVQRNIGLALLEMGGAEDALDFYTREVRNNPNSAQAHNSLGVAYMGLDNSREAANHFARAVQIKPGDAEMHSNLGAALAGQGKINDAIAQHIAALKIRPDYAEAHNSLGVAYMGQGNSREAANHFARAVQIKPDNAEMRGNLGAALNKQGRLKEARSSYQEALRLNPDHVITHHNLGKLLAGQGLIEEAVAHYNEALRIEPESATVHIELGDVLIKQNQFNEAAQHYKEALQRNPDNAETHNNLGVALANLGNLPEAVEHFSMAVKLKPDYKDAKRNLEAGLRLKAQLEQNNR